MQHATHASCRARARGGCRGRDSATAEGQAALRAVAELQQRHGSLWAAQLQGRPPDGAVQAGQGVDAEVLDAGFGSRVPLVPGMKVKVTQPRPTLIRPGPARKVVAGRVLEGDCRAPPPYLKSQTCTDLIRHQQGSDLFAM